MLIARTPKLIASIPLIVIAVALAACSSDPLPQPTARTIRVVPVTEERAIDIALSNARRAAPEVTSVDNPRDPYAVLMAMSDSRRLRSLGSGEQIQSSKDALGGSDLATGERYAWVVQLEGESYPAGISAGSGDVYRYSVFVIDAIDGSVPMSSRRYEPFFVHGFPDLSEYP